MHRLALPHEDVAAAIETARALGSGQPAVKLAFEFLVLTAARSGEVRLATWAEMDTAGRVWTISASTLPKMLQYHRVAAMAHGFRSSFRDWAAEETDHPRTPGRSPRVRSVDAGAAGRWIIEEQSGYADRGMPRRVDPGRRT